MQQISSPHSAALWSSPSCWPWTHALLALGFFAVASAVGCGDDRVGEGEPCEVGADCSGTLVCAYEAEAKTDGETEESAAALQVCAQIDDTWPEPNCNPNSDLTMACGLILKQSAGKPCSTNKACRSGQCAAAGDGGTGSVCAP